MKKLLLTGFLLIILVNSYAQTTDTVQVFFTLNDSAVNAEGTKTLDSLIFNNILFPGQKLTILGYGDYLGGQKYNEQLSSARAKKVKDFLMASGFYDADIKLYRGMGKIERQPLNNKNGYAYDRKVQIIIDNSMIGDSITAAVPLNDIPLTDTITFDTSHETAYKTTVSDLNIATIKQNETIILNNILFIGGEDILLPQSFPELRRLYEFLNANKSVRIRIEGHICCSSYDTPYGKSTLSLSRAVAIYKYLVEKGIDKSRLKVKGYGHSRPLANPEITESDRMQNRRVEIRILSK